MKRYLVTKGFHIGEICKDLTKDSIIFFNPDNGDLKIGLENYSVRTGPLVGAAKRGWLQEDLEVDSTQVVEEKVKFTGVEEAQPIPGKVKEKSKKKVSLEHIVYEEDSKRLDGQKESKKKQKAKKIPFENREDERAMIEFAKLKNLANVKDSEDILKKWDSSEHWAKKKKKMQTITNVNTLMRLASIDPKMQKYIDEHLKKISPLGQEVDQNLNSLEVSDKKSVAGFSEESSLKETKNSKKATKPNIAPLGEDFDEYMQKELKKGSVEIQRSQNPPKT